MIVLLQLYLNISQRTWYLSKYVLIPTVIRLFENSHLKRGECIIRATDIHHYILFFGACRFFFVFLFFLFHDIGHVSPGHQDTLRPFLYGHIFLEGFTVLTKGVVGWNDCINVNGKRCVTGGGEADANITQQSMMTSGNGNAFCITGQLWTGSAVHRRSCPPFWIMWFVHWTLFLQIIIRLKVFENNRVYLCSG